MKNEKIIEGNAYLFRLNFSDDIGVRRSVLEKMDGTLAYVKEVRYDCDSVECYFEVINCSLYVPPCSLVELVSEQIKISKVRGGYDA